MAHLARSVATLRIFGDDLIPDELSGLLGCTPTDAYLKGSVRTLKSGREVVRKTGAWFLDAHPTEPEDLNRQVLELLARLTDDKNVWTALKERFELDLFCGWFMKEGNEGVSLSAASMWALGERGIELSIDIYSPPDESSDALAQQGIPADASGVAEF